MAIERVSWRRAAALGLVQGAFTNALTQSWLVAGLHGAGAASVPAAGAAFVVLSLWLTSLLHLQKVSGRCQ